MFAPLLGRTQHKPEKISGKKSPSDATRTKTKSAVPLSPSLKTSWSFTGIPVLPPSPIKLPSGLSIGKPNDPSEQEAERIAERALSTPTQSSPSGTSAQPTIPFASPPPGLRSVRPGTPTAIRNMVHSEGQPLDSESRNLFQPQMGYDLTNVRIHSSPDAANSARSVRANAFTVGNHIVFNQGRFAPHSPDGRRLLAHELSHVVQNQTDPSSSMVIRREPAEKSWTQKAGELYDKGKWKVYHALIAAFKTAKNTSLNALRKLVPHLPDRTQSAVMAIIDGTDMTCDIFIALMLAIIGLAVGFVEGIVGLVTGILKMAYGLLKLSADYLMAVFGAPDAYFKDLDGIVTAIKNIPAGLSKVVNEWLEKYKHASAEDQVLMGAELVGQLEAVIASFALVPGKAGQAANAAGAAERGAAATEGAVDAAAAAAEKAPLADAPAVAGEDAEIENALNNMRAEGEPVQLQPHEAATQNRQALGQSGSEVQSAHGAPQSVMKRVPGYNPRQALTTLMDRTAHTGMDRFWKQTFQAMQKAGRSTATAREVEQIVAESIRRAPALSAGQKSSLIARLSDEMFVEFGLRPDDVLDLPYAHLAP